MAVVTMIGWMILHLAISQRPCWEFLRPLRQGDSAPSMDTAFNEDKESASKESVSGGPGSLNKLVPGAMH